MENFVAFKKIDDLGRIVIPKDFRNFFGISANDKLKIVPTKDGILITASNVKSK